MINIFFAVNEKFAKWTSVSLLSILKNHTFSKPSDKLRIFFLGGASFSKKTKEKLLSLKKYQDFECLFLDIDTSELSLFPTNLASIPLHTYYKLMITEIMPPEIEKIICLDGGDLILNGDISKLWDIDIDDYYLAAVKDYPYQLIKNNPEEHFEGHSERYYNGGVLLMNLKKLREFNFYEKWKAFAMDKDNISKIVFVDQDVLNAVISEKVLILPPLFNMLTIYAKEFLAQKKNVEDIVIIHFAGAKPWHPSCVHPLREIYFKYMPFSPWDLTSKTARLAAYLDFVFSFLRKHPLFFLEKKYWFMIKNVLWGKIKIKKYYE